jgi:hypothetical protein
MCGLVGHSYSDGAASGSEALAAVPASLRHCGSGDNKNIVGAATGIRLPSARLSTLDPSGRRRERLFSRSPRAVFVFQGKGRLPGRPPAISRALFDSVALPGLTSASFQNRFRN